MLAKYEKSTEQLSKDISVLQGMFGGTWKKEDELRELKTELATLNRQIQLSLKPVEQCPTSGEEIKAEWQEKTITEQDLIIPNVEHSKNRANILRI